MMVYDSYMNMSDILFHQRPEICRLGSGIGLSVLGMVFLAGCQTMDDEILNNGPPVVAGSVDGAGMGSAPAGMFGRCLGLSGLS